MDVMYCLLQPGSEGGLIFLAFVGGCAISTLFLTTWFCGDITYQVNKDKGSHSFQELHFSSTISRD